MPQSHPVDRPALQPSLGTRRARGPAPRGRWLLAAAALAGALALSACGGGGGGDGPSTGTAQATDPAVAAAARAGLSVQTFGGYDSGSPKWVTLAFIDTLDNEIAYRLEQQVGSSWQPVRNVSPVAGTGSTVTITEHTLTADTAYRVSALLPDGRAVPMQTPSQQDQVTARVAVPGVAIVLNGADQPVSGDGSVSLSGGGPVRSVQYAAIPRSSGAAGDGGLGQAAALLAGPDFKQTWKASTMADGDYLLLAKVELEAGNFTEIWRAISVHNSGLKVGVAADVAGAAVTLKLQLESNVQRPSYAVLVDGRNVLSATLDSGWQAKDLVVDLGTLAAGRHTVAVRASDSTGAAAEASTAVAVVGTLTARMDVTDGSTAFDRLTVTGYGGTPGSSSAASVKLSLDGNTVATPASGDFSVAMDLATVAAGNHVLKLDVADNSGATSVSRTITVQALSPGFRMVKTLPTGNRAPALYRATGSGRLVVVGACAETGGRTCYDMTTPAADTGYTRLGYDRSASVLFNDDWTYYYGTDYTNSLSRRLLAVPGNAIPQNFGTCTAPAASTLCTRAPEAPPVKEWAFLSDYEPLSYSPLAQVLRNLLTGVERAYPGDPLGRVKPVATSKGGWQITVFTGTGYAVYDTDTDTSRALALPTGANNLTSDGKRLVWLGPFDNAQPQRRQLYAALPTALGAPRLLADYTITDGSTAYQESTRAGGGWVVWAERDTTRGVSTLKADDGTATRVLATAATIFLLAFDADTGAVVWRDDTRTLLWVPDKGTQTLAVGDIAPALMGRTAYLLKADGTLLGLGY